MLAINSIKNKTPYEPNKICLAGWNSVWGLQFTMSDLSFLLVYVTEMGGMFYLQSYSLTFMNKPE